MKFFTIHFQFHDANITYFDGEKAHYLKSERVRQIKKHYYERSSYVLDDLFSNVHEIKKDCAFMNIDWHNLDAVAFTMGEFNNPDEEHAMSWQFNDGWLTEVSEDIFERLCPMLDLTAKKYYRIEHHWAHKLSADWLYGEMQKGLVMDGAGDYGNWFSIFDREERIADYRVWDSVSLGHLYTHAANLMLNDEHPPATFERSGCQDLAGNLMGLMSYGEMNEEYADKLRAIPFPQSITYATNEFEHRMTSGDLTTKKYDIIPQTNSAFWHMCDWIHTWQEVMIEQVIAEAKKYFDKDEKFSFSGGVAHNVVLNEALNREFPNMVVPPCVGDEGQSLGAMYALLKMNDIKAEWPEGQAIDEEFEEPTDETISLIADYIANGKIVAVVQGKGEIGPRALGNRSILYPTNMEKVPELLNRRGIKKREWWRPYGISILKEDYQDYLDATTESPYMLHTAQCTNYEAMRGVIHTDGSIRYQTVDESNGWYYKLLKDLKQRTGIPAVTNTSLNSKGKPLVHDRYHAYEFMQKARPDVMFIGNDCYMVNTKFKMEDE